ncbi:MAG: hypothetical protein NTX64_09860 [Elusimicrobia bacterium]|nr:hypothetical protein [Elusimicrobiota bacterium]
MKSLLLLLSLVLPYPASSNPPADTEDPPDVLQALNNMDQSGKKIKAGDQETKNASPERKQEIQQQRNTEVNNIIDTGSKFPENPKVNIAAGKALQEVNEPARGLPFADRAVGLRPKDPQALVLRGTINYDLKNYPGAEQDARSALMYHPGDPNAAALLNLIVSRVPSKLSLPSAQEAARQANERLSGTAGELPPEEGSSGAASGNAAGARTLQGRANQPATAASPQFARLLSDAEQKIAIGDGPGALSLADRAVKAKPNDSKALATRATAKLVVRDFQGALQDAGQAAFFDASYGRAFFIQGRAKQALGYPSEQVLAEYRRAAELDPRYAQSYNDAMATAAHGSATGEDGKSAAQAGGERSGVRAAAARLLPGPIRRGLRKPAGVALALGIGVVIAGLLAFALARRSERSDSQL